MKFNISRLDKVLLIQTLYYHASPKGYGVQEYAQLLRKHSVLDSPVRFTKVN